MNKLTGGVLQILIAETSDEWEKSLRWVKKESDDSLLRLKLEFMKENSREVMKQWIQGSDEICDLVVRMANLALMEVILRYSQRI